MTLLLDSNALLWLLAGDPALGSKARARLAGDPKLCVSDVSLLEISVKAAKRKLNSPSGLAGLVERLGMVRIGVRDEYLDAMRELPFHHSDPFDRYLIAQSLVDSIPIVTADRAFAQYGIRVVDARE